MPPQFGLNRSDWIVCRFHTVAYLQQIWWFEVAGEVEFHFPAGTYSLFFRLQLGRVSKRLGRRVCNPEHVHGWDKKPVHFQLSTSDDQCVQSQCYLQQPGNWIHYHAGDFVVENSDALTKVKFSMTQIDCTHTKGGLCVDSVVIFPSGLREKAKLIWFFFVCVNIGGVAQRAFTNCIWALHGACV